MHLQALESRCFLSAAPPAVPPSYDHVVVVIEENHSFNSILGPLPHPNPPEDQDPYIRLLASTGAIFTQSHGIGHPSEPNYLALFSGSTQGVIDDSAPPVPFTTPNLATELSAAGGTFAQYSESLPSAGYSGDDVGSYSRHHNPTVDFSNVPPSDNQPMTAFPRLLKQLPTVSFVVPNLADDMHSGTVLTADRWLHKHLGTYASWARRHNSLLIVTTDESDTDSSSNQVATFFVGAHIRHGRYATPIDHFNILSTIEAMEGLPPMGDTTTAPAITNVFRG